MKKILALFLAAMFILSVFCSCTVENVGNDTDDTSDESNIDLTYTEENAILLSGDAQYRIVYADGISRALVQNIRNTLSYLDENEKSPYTMEADTDTHDDGSPEILVGLTDRAASQEAKALINSPLDYVIMISGNKIAIYAATDSALTEAVLYFKAQLTVNEIGQVFYPSKENYIKKVTSFSASDLTIDGETIKSFSIVIPENAERHEIIASNDLESLIMEKTGAFIQVKTDAADISDHEILIGNTNRQESKELSIDTIDVGGDFRLSVENGKLAIGAGTDTGYQSAFTYVQSLVDSLEKEITSDHSNYSLSTEEITSVTVGAALIDKKEEGLYFYKCTAAQMTQWATHSSAIADRATQSTGVRLDFYTDSSFFGFRLAPSSGTSFELHINGEYKKTVSASATATYYEALDTSNGENRITLIFPSKSKGALSAVQLSKDATLREHTYDTNIMFMGDSITQGIGTSDDSHSFAHITSKYFNANSIIQGVGGGVFDAKTIDLQLNYDPEYIIVAFGCNDWNRYKNDENGFRTKVTEFMDKLKQTYPNATVICITPIPRLDYSGGNYDLTLEETRAIIESECAERGFYSVSGTDMLPAEDKYYNDDLHPNTVGYELYGENLCKAIEGYIK